jgi:hypothetical protein
VLAPGQSRTVTVRATTPAIAGRRGRLDRAELGGGFGGETTSIPVTLRSLVDVAMAAPSAAC